MDTLVENTNDIFRCGGVKQVSQSNSLYLKPKSFPDDFYRNSLVQKSVPPSVLVLPSVLALGKMAIIWI